MRDFTAFFSAWKIGETPSSKCLFLVCFSLTGDLTLNFGAWKFSNQFLIGDCFGSSFLGLDPLFDFCWIFFLGNISTSHFFSSSKVWLSSSFEELVCVNSGGWIACECWNCVNNGWYFSASVLSGLLFS